MKNVAEVITDIRRWMNPRGHSQEVNSIIAANVSATSDLLKTIVDLDRTLELQHEDLKKQAECPFKRRKGDV
jgi:hypothetical protein